MLSRVEAVVSESTFSFWMTLFPPAWQAAQLPAKTCAPFSKSAANAAGAMAIMPAKKAAATFFMKFSGERGQIHEGIFSRVPCTEYFKFYAEDAFTLEFMFIWTCALCAMRAGAKAAAQTCRNHGFVRKLQLFEYSPFSV
jgi:hypothetical protein